MKVRTRGIGIVYAGYFLAAIAGGIALRQPAGSAEYVAGTALELLSTIVYAVLTVLFYRLFAPVNRPVAAVAALASFAGCALQIFSIVTHVQPVLHAALAFFGIFCILLGYLIATSSFIPKALGVAMFLAGIGWLTFLAPALSSHVTAYAQAVGFLAEALLMLWLVIWGIPAQVAPAEA